ncbi:MAG: glycoside hydrolase family 25 protein [Ruminococcus sp.]|jgi:GH25 family lysozyme M1 (1,4-beta-N-acetylmuramidase)|nr:glycoside hydrolase family 25 protein [Ruminococcus sp.]
MNKKIAAILILALAIILTLIALVIIGQINIGKLKAENLSLSAYASAVPTFTYPESTDLVTIKDSYLGEISIAALEGVPRNSYDFDNLYYSDGRYRYEVDGFITSSTGIDVSYYSETIDWEAVKADGIDFAMIRVGYRGYESGELTVDTKFHEYIAGAIDAGVDVGVYFYSQAVDAKEALEEAEFVIEQIKPYQLSYPVALDIEITSAENVRQNEVSGEVLTEVCEVFCDRIFEEGYRPMVYANKRMAYLKLDMRRVCKYDFWYAEHDRDGDDPTFAYDFRMWQYSSEGKVDGINTPVDLNICFYNYNLD